MKRIQKLMRNNDGSANPVLIFIICLGLASFLILLFGHVLEPFMNLMESSDDIIDSEISAPRGYLSQIIQIVWPRGVLLAIFVALSFALFMEYQKIKYKEIR